MTLEEILQKYFGCKRPFDKHGELTNAGLKAFQKLETLCGDLQSLGIVLFHENELYNILNENY